MHFDPLRQFTGRKEEAERFNELVSGERWVMLVDGLSGTGKTLLLDWLRRHRCVGVPNAKLTLSQSSNPSDLLLGIADQLSPVIGKRYREALRQSAEGEQHTPLVNYSPSLSMGSRLGGSISNASQQMGDVVIEAGGYADLLRMEKEARRLDLFVNTMDELATQTWILFIDEAGYLQKPDLKELLLGKLIPRLRSLFIGFRLYMTGQTVPRDQFSNHEQISCSLGSFTLESTSELLAKIGTHEETLSNAVFTVTLGHPLLLGMLAEDILAQGGDFDPADLEGNLDERARTRWIYQRILSRLNDKTLREVAANLSLFEWFDLSLLRAVFSQSLSEEDFDDLCRRSFIKNLERGKWRCHDIIIKHLRPQRTHLAPDEMRQIHQRIFGALQRRCEAEEAKTGVWNFGDRISLTSATLHSALAVSHSRARDFLISEIAAAFRLMDAEYIYSFIRFLESRNDLPDDIAEFAGRTRETLGAMNLGNFGQQAVDFIDTLAQHEEKQGEIEIAAELLEAAALMAQLLGATETALGLAQRAQTHAPSPKRYRLTARLLAEGSAAQAAGDLLREAAAEYGDSEILRLGHVDIALAQDDQANALQILADTIATFPKAFESRLRIAKLLAEDEKYEAAITQVDAILEVDSAHSEALHLRLEFLGCLGRMSEAVSLATSAHLPLARIVDGIQPLFETLDDPIARGRLLRQVLDDSESVPTALALGLALSLAQKGDVNATAQVLAIIRSRWPESNPICDSTLACALVLTGETDAAASLLEPLVARGVGNIDSYLWLSISYGMQDRFEEQLSTLRALAEHFPSTRDIVDGLIASSYIRREQPREALKYLRRAKRLGALGPYAREALANAYIKNNDLPRALQIFEELTLTVDRGDFPTTKLIETRSRYAMLLIRCDEHAQATEIAYDLMAAPTYKLLTAWNAALIFFELGNESGLRTALRSTNNWDPVKKGTLYGCLSILIQARTTDIDALVQEFEANPDRIEIIMAIDGILTRSDRIDDVPEIVSTIERIAPGTWGMYKVLQQDLIKQGTEAIQQLRAMTIAKPDDIEPRLALARMLMGQKHFDEAALEFKELVSRHEHLADSALGIQTLGLLEAGEIDAAEKLLAPYVNELPPPYPLLEALAKFHKQREDFEAEIRLHQSVAKNFSDHRQAALEHIVDINIAHQKFSKALEQIERMEAAEALQPGLLLSKVDALNGLKRFHEAREILDELVQLSKLTNDLRSLMFARRAKTWRLMGESENAIADYLEAIALNPSIAHRHFALSEILIEEEEWNSAYEALMTGLALAPEQLPEHEEKLRIVRQARTADGGRPSLV